MEVILKKVKVTQSVIKQVLTATEPQIKTFDVLGWYVDASLKKSKWILLSNGKTLAKWMMYNDVRVEFKNHENQYYVVTNALSWIVPCFKFAHQDDAVKMEKSLKQIKHRAQILGQIFI